jgi:hypothetical protein
MDIQMSHGHFSLSIGQTDIQNVQYRQLAYPVEKHSSGKVMADDVIRYQNFGISLDGTKGRRDFVDENFE